MILYGSSLSPFVRKTLAFAGEKGIELDVQPTGFPGHSPQFLEASPFKKMPALRDGDYVLADSSAIIHYLEAKHPEPALIPSDPELRGKVIWFDEFADTILTTCGAKMFFNRVVAPRFIGRPGDEAAALAAECEELPPILDYLERVVPDAGRFLVGESITLADIGEPLREPRPPQCRGRSGAPPADPRLCRKHPLAAELQAVDRARDRVPGARASIEGAALPRGNAAPSFRAKFG